MSPLLERRGPRREKAGSSSLGEVLNRSQVDKELWKAIGEEMALEKGEDFQEVILGVGVQEQGLGRSGRTEHSNLDV